MRAGFDSFDKRGWWNHWFTNRSVLPLHIDASNPMQARNPVTHEPILGEFVFLFPVPDGSRRKRLAMIGQVGGNYMKARRDVAIFKDMPILAPIRSRRVLAYHRRY